MSSRPTCNDVRHAIAEFALGISTGEDRARALLHAAGCPRCRQELAKLSEVVDELLLMGPAADPPAGFESGVLGQLEEEKGRRGRSWRLRWRPPLAPVAAALAAGAAAAAGVYLATDDDREAASAYRRALQQANGSYFGALPLRDPGGRRAGIVFGYEGSPSWLFVLVRGAHGSGRWTVELRTRGRARIGLGSFDLSRGRGSYGRAIPVPLDAVTRISVAERGGARQLIAVPAARN
jgi:hypothetical protein